MSLAKFRGKTQEEIAVNQVTDQAQRARAKDLIVAEFKQYQETGATFDLAPRFFQRLWEVTRAFRTSIDDLRKIAGSRPPYR